MKRHVACWRIGLRLMMLALAISAPVSAHHSFAMFDKTRFLEADGVVHKIEWSNPHVYLYLSAKDADQGEIQYTFEGSSPNELNRWGWKVNSLEVGDQVKIGYFPLRDGRAGGLIFSVTLADGRVLKAN
jgi:hypothetical protein